MQEEKEVEEEERKKKKTVIGRGDRHTRNSLSQFDKRNYISIHSTCNTVAQPPSPPHKGMLANINKSVSKQEYLMTTQK
uniref:Uncharacterized protein n=1 Tax=Glossina palpalis gambiensis TaxID=67801 RepID=A0A1B0AYG9_9MUSC